MRNIFKIFGRDVKSLSRHFFAFVVAIAIMILPSLYAWLNIYSNWDPYGNTGNISIAVASMDKGYVTDTGEKVNKGDDIIEDLRESTAINWVITDSEEQAVNGVYSGEYYAAVVIDENFSYNMYNMLTMWNGKPEITYYENAKKNAVATKITDTAVESLKRSINENYLEVLISGIMEQANVISAEIAEDNPREALHVVLQQALTTLNAAQRALDNFAAGGSGNISIDTSELDKIIADINSKLPEGSEIRDNVAQIDLAVYEALEKVQASLDRLQNAIESGNAEAIAAAKKAVEKAAADAIACGDKVSGWGDAIPGDTQVGQDAKALAQKIADNFYDLGKWLNALPHRDDIQEAIGDCTDIVDTIFGLTDTIVPSAEELTKAVEDIFLNVATTLDSVRKLNNDALVLRDAVESTKAALDDTLHAMQPAASRVITSLTETIQKLDSITTDEDYFAALVDLLGGSPAVYGQYLAQIVQTSVTPIYPIANYGSAMAPFYTILSIWVGAIILVAMLKVSISDHEKARILGVGNDLPLGSEVGLREAMIAGRIAGPAAALDVLKKPRAEAPGNARQFGLRLHHEYFGRYMIFGFLALLQGTLVCLGDMFYLGVQCEHPIQFLMVGWLSALVFSNIVYTLTLSFGDIGKAIAVVLLVMQVAGSGGTFPIETLPTFFQVVSKWLLFPYAVDAMHSAMAGSFGMEYWVSMGKLALFLVPSLLLGLMLRKPVIRFNDWVIRNLENTKVM